MNLGMFFLGLPTRSSWICLGHEFTKHEENIMAALYGTIRGPIPIEASHL